MGRHGEPGVYKAVYRLIKTTDPQGGMRWRSGGSGGGGVWVLELQGRTAEVPVHGREKNRLDELYVPKVHDPRRTGGRIHPAGSLSNTAICSADFDASGRREPFFPTRWARTIQDAASELPGTTLLGRTVNKGR